jgi:polyhydroxybutyrate depolymerase
MRHIVYIIALLVISNAAFAQMRYDVRITVDSVERYFIVSKPTGPTPTGGYPLVFMFHGTAQDGELFYNESQWKEKGETEKFISVFPTALRYCIIEDGIQKNITKWHNGEAEEMACPGQYLKDDTRFVRAMIDTIMDIVPIDRSRIYASGFSNGGSFTSKLAVEMSDVFAAVAVAGGALSDGDSALPKENIPVWWVLGTRDDKWLKRFEGIGLDEFPFNDSTLAYLANPLGRFVGTFGLSQDYAKDSIRNTITYRFTTPAGSTPATEFRFTLIDNMFHVYPNGNNVQFVAANFFWDFFSRFTQTSSVPDLPVEQAAISVYPNPAGKYLIVDGATDVTLTLRTLVGKPVFTSPATSGRRIALPELPAGTYIAEISSSNRRTTTLIVLR